MSRLATGFLSVITLSLISGAAQFALGRDLSPVATADKSSSMSTGGPPAAVINRDPKGDRILGPMGSPAQTKTVSLKLDGFSDTSFLLRVPVADGEPSPPALARPGGRRSMVACEPVVSVLTDVAKRLEPGRCVT